MRNVVDPAVVDDQRRPGERIRTLREGNWLGTPSALFAVRLRFRPFQDAPWGQIRVGDKEGRMTTAIRPLRGTHFGPAHVMFRGRQWSGSESGKSRG